MPSNVEIKAVVRNIDYLIKKAKELSNGTWKELVQQDTYFQVPKGRLKLRQIAEEHSELIYYERVDAEGPKQSQYKKQFIQTSEVDGLKEILMISLGMRGVVRKKRVLYLVGQTRVHVDEVERLGHFMELEVMLEAGQSVEEGQKIADDLMEKLGVTSADLLAGSYIDMLLAQNK